ncbi:MAG: hypothetical protein FJX72_21580 [Armatimonadetes bacterium]|nr:hypothetical protein [Armatimonadota bacterium]
MLIAMCDLCGTKLPHGIGTELMSRDFDAIGKTVCIGTITGRKKTGLIPAEAVICDTCHNEISAAVKRCRERKEKTT